MRLVSDFLDVHQIFFGANLVVSWLNAKSHAEEVGEIISHRYSKGIDLRASDARAAYTSLQRLSNDFIVEADADMVGMESRNAGNEIEEFTREDK